MVPSHKDEGQIDLLIEQLARIRMDRIKLRYDSEQMGNLLEEIFEREKTIMGQVAENLEEISDFKEKWRTEHKVAPADRVKFNQCCNKIEELLQLRRHAAYTSIRGRFYEERSKEDPELDPNTKEASKYRIFLQELYRLYQRYYDVVRQARETYRLLCPKYPHHPSEEPNVESDPHKDHYKWYLGPSLNFSQEDHHGFLAHHEKTTPHYDFKRACKRSLFEPEGIL